MRDRFKLFSNIWNIFLMQPLFFFPPLTSCWRWKWRTTALWSPRASESKWWWRPCPATVGLPGQARTRLQVRENWSSEPFNAVRKASECRRARRSGNTRKHLSIRWSWVTHWRKTAASGGRYARGRRMCLWRCVALTLLLFSTDCVSDDLKRHVPECISKFEAFLSHTHTNHRGSGDQDVFTVYLGKL